MNRACRRIIGWSIIAFVLLIIVAVTAPTFGFAKVFTIWLFIVVVAGLLFIAAALIA